MPLDLAQLTEYVTTHAGIRSVVDLEPLGGWADKIFPPTYGVADGTIKYAVESRTVRGIDGQPSHKTEAVVLNSVAAQAHECSGALLDAFHNDRLQLPLVGADFTDFDDLAEYGIITDLEAPHRVYDAIFRDSLDGDIDFRQGEIGKAVTAASPRNATSIFINAPSALLFGGWDSTGPRGGLGAKFERALTSEIVAFDVEVGRKTSSRIDPLGIQKKAGPVYLAADRSTYSMEKSDAGKGAKSVAPSEVNHGNIAPSIDDLAGGITAGRITATSVLSCIQLRRLAFGHGPADTAARTTLAALGIASLALAFEVGFDLRSRCVLAPTSDLTFEAIGRTGSVDRFTVSGSEALDIVSEAISRTDDAGLPWRSGLYTLTPTDRLVALTRRSRELTAADESVDA